MGGRLSFWSDKNILELDRGDVCKMKALDACAL